MVYTTVGNRKYQLETRNEYDLDGTPITVDYVMKCTLADCCCGEWTSTVFLAHASTFDDNTETEYASIKTALGI